jgi:hypothetical protein
MTGMRLETSWNDISTGGAVIDIPVRRAPSAPAKRVAATEFAEFLAQRAPHPEHVHANISCMHIAVDTVEIGVEPH